MGTVFVDMNPFYRFRINVSRHIRAFVDDQNLFPLSAASLANTAPYRPEPTTR